MEAKQKKQFLTFTLGDEIYALDIFRVCEVLEFTKATRVPKAPRFMRGVINLRGKVVPVVDLNLKFGLPQSETTINTCIIIVELLRDNQLIILGALADSVQEVLEINAADIAPPPKVGTKLRVEFIEGMGQANEGFFIILNMDNIFLLEELALA